MEETPRFRTAVGGFHKTDVSEKLHNMKQQKTYYSKKQFMQGGKYVFIY